jgi:L-seryl-tRNA(Ser) seleniumtransferase
VAKKENSTKISAKIQKLLQAIPKVDEFINWVGSCDPAPPRLVKNEIRFLLAAERKAILAGEKRLLIDLSKEKLLPKFKKGLARRLESNFRTVINATGVVVHTNLGRSLLPEKAMASIQQVGKRYANLEFNLNTGKRGSRYQLVEELLCELTGAEAALVVNNNAAAVLLVLETLAKDQEVIVSRGQLVEIGGSFRIPDVMAKSGAKMVEVGATNRTHLYDYEQAITPESALLLKVHTSNFRIIGFTSEVELSELVALGREHDLLVMEDLGSGCLLDLSSYGLPREPTVGEVVKAGVDVVTFSGDKLLGGPQAGLIIGKKNIIDQVKKNPLNRALRIDKFTLAGLEAVLRLYYDDQKALETIPTLNMMTMAVEQISRRATRLSRRIKKELTLQCEVTTMATSSRVGGGAMPEHGLPSRAVVLAPKDRTVNELERQLRDAPLPVIGRIEDDYLLLDLRTVNDDEIVRLGDCLLAAFAKKI